MKIASRATASMVCILASCAAAQAAADKIQESLSQCNPHQTTPLSTIVPCLKAMIAASSDPVYNATDPATQLFLLDISKLVSGTGHKRLPESVAQERFLRLVVTLEDRHRQDLQAAQTREYSEQQARISADRMNMEAELAQEREAKRDEEAEQQRQQDSDARESDRQEAAALAGVTAHSSYKPSCGHPDHTGHAGAP